MGLWGGGGLVLGLEVSLRKGLGCCVYYFVCCVVGVVVRFCS